jgi:hypothetical protein
MRHTAVVLMLRRGASDNRRDREVGQLGLATRHGNNRRERGSDDHGKRKARQADGYVGNGAVQNQNLGMRQAESGAKMGAAFSDQGPKYIEGPFEAVKNCGLRWAMRVTRLPDEVRWCWV